MVSNWPAHRASALTRSSKWDGIRTDSFVLLYSRSDSAASFIRAREAREAVLDRLFSVRTGLASIFAETVLFPFQKVASTSLSKVIELTCDRKVPYLFQDDCGSDPRLVNEPR